jgi:E3 ubiquitin-protein ligase SIAH1
MSTNQCKNGHAACESCCVRVGRVCSCCHEPIGDIRCLPLENAIAGMHVACAFVEHGCARRLRYAERAVHEALLCPHAPCACPVPGCAYAGLLLHDHILDAHSSATGDEGDAVVSFARSAASAEVALRRSTPFRVLLMRATDADAARVFLLVNGGDVPSGRSLSVVCIGPRPGENRSLEYRLHVRGAGSLALSASGPVPCTRLWAGHHPTEAFLFVPDAYWSSSSACVSVTVTVHVRKITGDKP